ncbi:VOC family protein [Streptomyces caelestis]|uniref:VOC family protein n=1 Tax=Streptomyces caelestis TaxID=36816 RepID=UPI003658EF68
MAAPPEGTPCWADAVFTDVEGAKSFYGDVLGWTFAEAPGGFGGCAEARADGRAAAAVVPPAPGQEGAAQWCLYFAAADAAATAARIREHGGELLMGPTRIGGLGTMCTARDPGGVVFGLWQAGAHEGFGATAGPGAYRWAEVLTREPEKSDAFFPAVFAYRSERLGDGTDFRVYGLGERGVLGRLRMTDAFPPGTPPYVNVYFTVADCDEAVTRATDRGGVLRFGPTDTPSGRFAALSDPQGANFSVSDVAGAAGEPPPAADGE